MKRTIYTFISGHFCLSSFRIATNYFKDFIRPPQEEDQFSKKPEISIKFDGLKKFEGKRAFLITGLGRTYL